MKKIIAFTLLFGLGPTLMANTIKNFAQDSHKVAAATEVGIKFFSGTWAEALAEATKENKVIFLDAYAAWCGPCKLMTANTFTDEKVGTYFNKNFINYKMDMEKHADGPRLSGKYGLKAYPTLYFIDGKENVVHQTLGYHEPAQLIGVGETVVGLGK